MQEKNYAKKSPSAHHRTSLLGCIFASKACIDNQEKLVKWQYLLHMCTQYGELWPLTAEICWRVWGIPANFNRYRILLSLLTDVAQRRLTKLCTMFGRLLCWYTIYTFWGLLPLTEFCQLQNSLCIQVMLSPILIAFLHGTRVAAVSQTLWHGTRNGITEIGATCIWLGEHHVGHRPTSCTF